MAGRRRKEQSSAEKHAEALNFSVRRVTRLSACQRACRHFARFYHATRFQRRRRCRRRDTSEQSRSRGLSNCCTATSQKASSFARSLVVLYSPRSNPFSGNPCLNSPSTLASRPDLPTRLYRRISQPPATVNRRIPRPRNNIRARRFRRPKLICRPEGKFPCESFGFFVERSRII